jgi:hypothetical protein
MRSIWLTLKQVTTKIDAKLVQNCALLVQTEIAQ